MQTTWRDPQLFDVAGFMSLLTAGKGPRIDYIAGKARRESLLNAWSRIMIEICSPLIELFILNVYTSRHDVLAPPPTLRYDREGTARPRAANIDPDTAFSVLDRAAKTHIHNVRLVLKAKDDVPEYNGLAETLSSVWERAELNMYYDLNGGDFRGCKQIAIVGDTSTHGSDDTLVVILYRWDLNRGCFAPIKILYEESKNDEVIFNKTCQREMII